VHSPPTDAHGNPAGATGQTLSTIVGVIAIALIAVGCYQLSAVRRAIYGIPGPLESSTAAADPAVAAYLAARARRQEARALAETDPVMAHDLGIGRPDLPGPYDDGGLVDLNSAPAPAIATGCSIDTQVAERIAATRQQLGSFSSLTELIALADLDEATAARIREHGVLIPK
jgi:Helix-hairpin-helix motif